MIVPSLKNNRSVYADPAVVSHYTKAHHLQPSESQVLRALSQDLPLATMLDIGVGGGRTTLHFAHRVLKYIGIDYSPPMVKACQANYPLCEIHEGDARNLSAFGKSKFDFVLFSFNGLGYMSHTDRLTALSQIGKALKPGGYFAFSAHNLEFPNSWKVLQKENSDWAILNDQAHTFQLATYYITPRAQVTQLLSSGFTNITLFGLGNPWVYYLTQRKRILVPSITIINP